MAPGPPLATPLFTMFDIKMLGDAYFNYFDTVNKIVTEMATSTGILVAQASATVKEPPETSSSLETPAAAVSATFTSLTSVQSRKWKDRNLFRRDLGQSTQISAGI